MRNVLGSIERAAMALSGAAGSVQRPASGRDLMSEGRDRQRGCFPDAAASPEGCMPGSPSPDDGCFPGGRHSLRPPGLPG